MSPQRTTILFALGIYSYTGVLLRSFEPPGPLRFAVDMTVLVAFVVLCVWWALVPLIRSN